MQPFDQGTFDKRFRDVFAPAIVAAGLEPYRVDQDPKVSIPIQDIERGIRDTSICLTEITNDNPNVWFELGFAIALNKPVVLVCSDERTTKFPFDVQHRSIIKYGTKSTSDFNELAQQITDKIKAFLAKGESIEHAGEVSKIKKFEGLEQHEVMALAALAANLDHPEDYASAYVIKRDMEVAGFTALAMSLAMKGLSAKGFVVHERLQDDDGDYYSSFQLTEEGWNWTLSNQHHFVLRGEPKPTKKP